MRHSQAAYPGPFLNGWKEISNYLGKGVRTVQRYEQELGLPVRRTVSSSHASVMATRAELDAWVSARPLTNEFALRQPLPHLASLETFRAALAEQHRLREELMKMRESLHDSLKMLRATVELTSSMHEKIKQDHDPTPFYLARGHRKPN